MKKTIKPQKDNTTYQLKMPVDIKNLIENSDEVFTFLEITENIDLRKYLVGKDSRMGRTRYDGDSLLKVILFAFMENGYASTRQIAKLCKTDIRYMLLLKGERAPSHMTIDNFMNHGLSEKIEDIFVEINGYIFEKEHVDTNHVYIDGTKIRANANKYSWVWKKSSLKSRDKVFGKASVILTEMNKTILSHGIKFGIRSEYAIEYLEEILDRYDVMTGMDFKNIKRGSGHRKNHEQRLYDSLNDCIEKLKKYSKHIRICGNERNSYSKTDNDATFMRMKRDYMGNDQLLPGYNLQIGVCDEYVSVFDLKRYASDMDCFKPLMEKFNNIYSKYPEYPIADAGYGSFNNYLYCEEHGMKKYMKFTMYEKETKSEKYREDPYRAVNFPIGEDGCPVCPGGKKFHHLRTSPVRGNKYGRCEEYYQCEDCSNCPHKPNCFKAEGNRVVRLNQELTSIHEEVLRNLNSTHGALLRMNRSIQAEGVFGNIKWNRAYSRARRRGLKGMFLELGLIFCGFNLYKYHLKKLQANKFAA